MFSGKTRTTIITMAQILVAVGSIVLLWLLTRYNDGPLLDWTVSGALWAGLIAGTFMAYRLIPANKNGAAAENRDIPAAAWTLMGMTVIYLGSSAVRDIWFFPTHWLVTGESTTDSLSDRGYLRAIVAMLVLIPLLRFFADRNWFWGGLFVVFAGMATMELHKTTGFSMIYRVDSPSFVYRYWCFEQTFPQPGFYDPHWNAGLRIPFLVATGVWSLGVFLLPLLNWISPDRLYTPVLAFVFLVVVPMLAWQSMAWVGASRRARWIAAVLALATCQRFYVHLLHYGTAPALFAMSMSLPIAALGYKYLYLDVQPKATTVLAIVVCGLIMFCWPGSLIIALPFTLVVLMHARRLFPRKWIWLLAGIAFIGLALLPLALVPMRYSNLEAFAQTTAAMSWWEHFIRGLGVLRHNLRGTNALIVVLGFAGAFFWPQRSARWFFSPLIIVLLLLSGWGEEVKKLMQTERMIIPAALIAIIPAAWWMDRLVDLGTARTIHRAIPHALARVFAALLVAVLATGAYQGAKTWRGKGLAPFQAMPPHIKELIEWIKANVPKEGRLMFAGPAVHGYGGAKIAALPMFTGREMMAADFYGFSPKLVEFQYPPRAFRYDGPGVLFEFMDLYNVTHIITYHKDWKSVFNRNPQHYRLVWESGRMAIYETLRPNSLFMDGSGQITAGFNRFDIMLSPGSQAPVLKYNWVEGLRAADGVEIFPYDAGRGVKLIGVNPGTNQQVVITYDP